MIPASSIPPGCSSGAGEWMKGQRLLGASPRSVMGEEEEASLLQHGAAAESRLGRASAAVTALSPLCHRRATPLPLGAADSGAARVCAAFFFLLLLFFLPPPRKNQPKSGLSQAAGYTESELGNKAAPWDALGPLRPSLGAAVTSGLCRTPGRVAQPRLPALPRLFFWKCEHKTSRF